MTDRLFCGDCQYQTNTVTSFLHHKAEHGASSSQEWVSCLLCDGGCKRSAALLNHYLIRHNIIHIKEHQDDDVTRYSSAGGKSSKPAVTRNRRHASAVAAPRLGEAVEQDVTRSANSDKVDEVDFCFALKTQMMTNTRLPFAKTLLCCLHCKYSCTVLYEILAHMQSCHTDQVVITGSSPPHPPAQTDCALQGAAADLNVLRFSEYRLQLQRDKGASTGTPDVHKCMHCSAQFFLLSDLQEHHMVTHDANKDIDSSTLPAKSAAPSDALTGTKHPKTKQHKEYTCSVCGLVCGSKAAHRSHNNLHKDSGGFECNICGKAYKLKDTLQKHKRVHDQTRPYACTVSGCSLRFLTERMCKGHIKTHYSVKDPFVCPHCSYVFRHKHHLKRHMETAHQVPYITRNGKLQEIETCEIPVCADELVTSTSSVEDNSTSADSSENTGYKECETAAFNIIDLLADADGEVNGDKSVIECTGIAPAPSVDIVADGSGQATIILIQSADTGSLTEHKQIQQVDTLQVPVSECHNITASEDMSDNPAPAATDLTPLPGDQLEFVVETGDEQNVIVSEYEYM